MLESHIEAAANDLYALGKLDEAIADTAREKRALRSRRATLVAGYDAKTDEQLTSEDTSRLED
jgi:hypothetical protein